MTDPKTAAEALETVRQSRAAVAERLTVGSMTYDLIYSALVGVMISSQGAPQPWALLVMGACGLTLALLARSWARRRGVFVNGLTPPRARWVAIGLGLLAASLMFGAVHLGRLGGQWPAISGLGLIGSIIAFAASRLWLRVFRRETGADA